MQELKIIEGAEEFSLGRGPVGALLVHGFTGSPDSLRPVGDYLSERGIGCFGIRLPGHGTTWEDLGKRTSSEWVDAVETAYSKMRTEHDEVFVVGLSFGVALTLDLATRHTGIPGVVSIAGFLMTKDPRRVFAPVISKLVKALPGVGNDICDPEGRELCYDKVPTAATYSMLRYVKRVRSNLGAVTCPLLVMHSHNDHTAHPDNAQLIFDNVTSADKELVWLDRSFHVLTLDHDREEVFSRTYEFIKQRTRIGV